MRNRAMVFAVTAASLAANLLRPEIPACQVVVRPWGGGVAYVSPAGVMPLNRVSSMENMPPNFPSSPFWSGEMYAIRPNMLTLPVVAIGRGTIAAARPVSSALAQPAAAAGAEAVGQSDPRKVESKLSNLSTKLAEAARPVGAIDKAGAETARDLGRRMEEIVTGAAEVPGDADTPPTRWPTWTPNGFRVPLLEGLTTDPVKFSLLTDYGKKIERKAKGAWDVFANPYQEPRDREWAAIILGEYWGGMQAYRKMLGAVREYARDPEDAYARVAGAAATGMAVSMNRRGTLNAEEASFRRTLLAEFQRMLMDPGVSQGARLGVAYAVWLLGGDPGLSSAKRDFELLVRYVQDALDQRLRLASAKGQFRDQAERYFAGLEQEAPEIKDFTGRYRLLIDLTARRSDSYRVFAVKLRGHHRALQALAEGAPNEQGFFKRFDQLIRALGNRRDPR